MRNKLKILGKIGMLANAKYKKTMPFLSGFQLRTLRRKPRSAQQELADKIALLNQKTFKQIGEVFEKFIPCTLLKQEQDGVMSRRRIFSKENTFLAFFSQVLDFEHTADRLDIMPVAGLLNNRRVIVVDGTGVSMPETPENQEVWPQSASQKGVDSRWPISAACFSLEKGALLSYAIGNKKNNELPLFRKQWKMFKQGDIFLGDKGFCSYFDIANLAKQDVDSVVILTRRESRSAQ